MTAGLSDEEFVGYTFRAAPEQRSRLWFLDRHLYPLIVWGTRSVLDITEQEMYAGKLLSNIDVGRWTVDLTREAVRAYYSGRLGKNWRDLDREEVIRRVSPGVQLRYQHHGTEPWVGVWRLTDVTIEHIHTFGRDDTWRLGLWPD